MAPKKVEYPFPFGIIISFVLYTQTPLCTVMQVCIVGSGNWGSAIARLVGFNAARLPERFQKEVTGQDSRSFHIFFTSCSRWPCGCLRRR